jgi:DNA-binding MarR family transcriptional regulator
VTAETASLTRQLRLLGNQLMALASRASLNHAAPADRSIFKHLEQDSDLWLLAAKDMYKERVSRRRFFSPGLFGEPAWDILLDLYIAEKESQSISISAACLGAQVPMSTALRHLKLLEQEGLVSREPDARDGRRHHVRISDKGYALMTAYIADQRQDWLADDLLRPGGPSQLRSQRAERSALLRIA